MNNHSKRAALALVVAAATAATAVSAAPTVAYASHPGTGDTLTSFTSTSIRYDDGTFMNVPAIQDDGGFAWSTDGSRAVYVGNDLTSDNNPNRSQSIMTVRYDGGLNPTASALVWGPDSGQRSHPVWSEDGYVIYFAQRASTSQPWNIGIATSAAGWDSGTLSSVSGTDLTLPDAGPTGVVVAQSQADNGSGTPTGTPSIVQINVQTGATTTIIDSAGQPAVAPDGQHIAFIRSDGTWDQVYTSDLSGGNVTQVTANDANHWSPTWSPDGTTVAFGQSGNSVVTTAAADGSAKATPTEHPNLAAGVPAYRPKNVDHVVTLAGSDRYITSVDISQTVWATAGAAGDPRMAAKSVVLTRSDTFADAISGGALAAAKQGPLLMTPTNSLNAVTKTEIQRILGTSTTAIVYILGSTGSVSASVENAIKAMGYKTSRLQGSNRYATSIKIAQAITDNPQYILLSTGLNFPDALGAGAAAGSYNANSTTRMVVVLTNDKKMPTETETYLEGFLDSNGYSSAYLYAIGGQADGALTSAGWSGYNVEAGSNRYITAEMVASDFFGGTGSAAVTTGLNWPDALSGGALCGTINAPLLLSDETANLVTPAKTLLNYQSGSINTALIFGHGLPASNATQIGTAISGPGGFDIGGSAPGLAQSVKASTAKQKSSQLKLLANTAKSTARHQK